MDRFAGRVAVVTGASSGIGATMAQDLARAGVVVVGVSRRLDNLTSLAASLAAEGASGRLEPVQADISSVDEVRRVYQWVEDNLGGVSILVNNAAMLLLKPLQDLDTLELQSIINTNLTSVMIGCKEAVDSMKRHNITDGHIININSVAGHVVINHTLQPISIGAYTATKHAITALSKGLRFDVQKLKGFKIRVTSLSPGTVQTAMLPKGFEERLNGAELLLRPDDVSRAALFALASPPGVEISELTIQPTGEGF